jgi:hypothetical protein
MGLAIRRCRGALDPALVEKAVAAQAGPAGKGYPGSRVARGVCRIEKIDISSVEQVHMTARTMRALRLMTPAILLLTGASGSGKTTAVRALRAGDTGGVYLHFDSIGVPDHETMVREFRSGSRGSFVGLRGRGRGEPSPQPE